MRITTILLFAMPLLVTAQNWCPPGATWNHDELSIGFTGHRHRVYEGDTIVLGQNAQRIRTTGIRVDLLLQDTVWIDQVQHTSLLSNVLMVPAWSPNGVAWDTLLRFDAVPGDRWYPPGYGEACAGLEPFGQYQVLDTSHAVVDGVSLRRWEYGILGPNGEIIAGNGFYYERVGFTSDFVPYPYCGTIIDVGEMLKCYRDADLTFLGPWTAPGTECDFILGAATTASVQLVAVAPNPGREQITLTLPSSPHLVEVLDALGHLVAMRTQVAGMTTIGTTQLPSGVYLIRVEGANGARTSLRWVKE